MDRSKYIAGLAYSIGTGEAVRIWVPDAEIDEALAVLHRAGVLPFQAEAKMMAAA